MSMRRPSIAVVLLGVVVAAGPGPSRAEPARPSATRVAAREAPAPVDRLIESRQHRLSPVHQGDQRTFTIEGREGARATAATLVERVTRLSVAGDLLRAEISATWIATGGRHVGMTGYHARRVEEVDRDGVLRATNRLDRAPIPGSAIEGVALPRNLEVGRRWTVQLSYTDGGRAVTSRIKRRVERTVVRRGPDGRLRPGVLIKWSEVRSRVGARRTAVERWTGTSVFLEGVGEVETRMKRRGGGAWFARRLAECQCGPR